MSGLRSCRVALAMALVGVLLAGGCGHEDIPRQAAALVQQGQAAMSRREFNDAYAAFRSAAKSDPGAFDAALGAASACAELGDVQSGQAWIKRALSNKANSAEAYDVRGRLNMLAGQYKTAVADFSHAGQLKPDLICARLNLVTALLHVNQNSQAIAEARAITHSAPQEASAHFALGQALEQSGDLSGAEAAYRQALSLDKNLAPANLRLASMLVQRKRDLDSAYAMAKLANDADPGDGTAAATMGYALYLRGNVKDGLQQMYEAANAHPQNASLWVLLGTASAASGYKDAARRCAAKAAEASRSKTLFLR